MFLSGRLDEEYEGIVSALFDAGYEGYSDLRLLPRAYWLNDRPEEYWKKEQRVSASNHYNIIGTISSNFMMSRVRMSAKDSAYRSFLLVLLNKIRDFLRDVCRSLA